MKKKEPPRSRNGTEIYILRLYVAGQTPKSIAAISNLKRICREHMKGRYRIHLIDLMAKPHLAKQDHVVALPTLVRRLPVPLRKIIGDLSNTTKVLVGLDLRKEPAGPKPGPQAGPQRENVA